MLTMKENFLYALKDFETYCLVLIEIERFKESYLTRMSDAQKQISISTIRQSIEAVLAKEKDIEVLNQKRAIKERLVREYEAYLYR